MTFRARLALVAAAAVALAVVAASGVVYLVVRDELYSSVDDSLRNSMERIQAGPAVPDWTGPAPAGSVRRVPPGGARGWRGLPASGPGPHASGGRARNRRCARPTRHLPDERRRRRDARPGDHVRVPADPRDRGPGRALAGGDGPRPRPHQVAPDRDRRRRDPRRSGAWPRRSHARHSLPCGA